LINGIFYKNQTLIIHLPSFDYK